MPQIDSILLNLPGFKLTHVSGQSVLTLHVEFQWKSQCPGCGSFNLRRKDGFLRRIRHVLYGGRPSFLEVMAYKFQCRNCKKYFNSRFPGVKPRLRATEPCRSEISKFHHRGWTQRDLQRDFRIGSATVERWYQDHFELKNKELKGALCPRILGIDEHFFSRKEGYATTLANLTHHKVFDVVLGRSEPSLRNFLKKIPGRERAQIVVMDLSETYRSISKKYFPNALVVADRFHVIRQVNHQFIKTWGELDERGRKNRGLLSLMRRHPNKLSPTQRQNLDRYLNEIPGLKPLYDVWQDLNHILRLKSQTKKQCRDVIPQLLWIIEELKTIPFKSLQTLGHTLHNWKEEIARMLRFTKTNGITEGLHNKMEMLSRRAFGFRNFENYRLRVRIVCG